MAPIHNDLKIIAKTMKQRTSATTVVFIIPDVMPPKISAMIAGSPPKMFK
jgi:hypothetical protein